jgi:hypothetical protein
LLCVRGGHRIHIEGEHAAEVSSDASDGAAETAVARDSTNSLAQRLTDLPEQVAEPTLRIELLLLLCCVISCNGIGVKREHAAEIPGDASDSAAETAVARDSADGLSKRLADLAEQIAEPTLRIELLLLLLLSGVGGGNGVDVEWQHAAEVPSDPADCSSEAAVTEGTADGLTKRSPDLSE